MTDTIKLNPLKLDLKKVSPRGLTLGKRQPGSSLLGLAFDGHRLEAVVLKRSNNSISVLKTAAASLELNLLTNDPELVGREIRNHLDRAGIRERQCAVCIPLDWALTLHIPVPELPEDDIQSFLNIEAERGLPFSQETLLTVSSRCRGAKGAQFATLIAIPKENLFTLQKVLKAAQLRPLSFSLGMTALQGAATSTNEGVAALAIGENNVELQVTCGGGIAALRTLQGALEQDGVRKKPYADVVARDLRITLGQLPAELRETVRRLRIFGNNEDLGRFVDELASRAKLMGLDLELVKNYAVNDLRIPAAPGTAVTPPFSLAARILAGQGVDLEFLPPKVSAWKQLTTRYSSRKLAWSGAAAGVAALLLVGAFLVQQWQLSKWRTTWIRMKPRVTQIDNMQQQIRRFRPWFDESYRSLSILKKLTEAFPEDGSVSASRVEIRDPGIITCSGTARDPQAYRKVLEQLQTGKEVASVQTENIRGKQFTITLRWGQGGMQ